MHKQLLWKYPGSLHKTFHFGPQSTPSRETTENTGRKQEWKSGTSLLLHYKKWSSRVSHWNQLFTAWCAWMVRSHHTYARSALDGSGLFWSFTQAYFASTALMTAWMGKGAASDASLNTTCLWVKAWVGISTGWLLSLGEQPLVVHVAVDETPFGQEGRSREKTVK
jgi:hypothetical protein